MTDEPKQFITGQVQTWIGQYVALRDAKEALEKKQKEDVKVYTDAMDKVEGRVQEFFTQTGQTSAPTAAGTAYLSTTYRASIADKQAFKSFVIGQSRWDLLDWKANVTATKDFAKEMKAPPAGVNLTSITKVNIRRPGQKTDDE